MLWTGTYSILLLFGRHFDTAALQPAPGSFFPPPGTPTGKVCQALGLPGASLGPREAGRSGGPPIPRGGGPGAGAALGRGQTNFLRLGSHRSPRTETPARGSAEPSPSPGPGATVITLKRQKHFLIFFFVCEVEISLLLLLCRFSRVRLCATP